jgi:hypothetical protein
MKGCHVAIGVVMDRDRELFPAFSRWVLGVRQSYLSVWVAIRFSDPWRGGERYWDAKESLVSTTEDMSEIPFDSFAWRASPRRRGLFAQHLSVRTIITWPDTQLRLYSDHVLSAVLISTECWRTKSSENLSPKPGLSRGIK